MLKKSKVGNYYFQRFVQQGGIIHGFSSRKFGNLEAKKSIGKNQKNLANFLKVFDKKIEDLVLMEQVHDSRIKVVGEKDKGKIILGVDGLITREKGLVLGVKSADCLPLLYFDPISRLIGIAHAGWRGILQDIPRKMIELMIRLGSLPENVLIGIGPHIGACCYCVDKDRAEKYGQKFGRLPLMLKYKKDKIFLDLEVVVSFQIKSLGILSGNVILPKMCTSCLNREFFSYRKDSKETYGEMLGVIGLIN